MNLNSLQRTRTPKTYGIGEDRVSIATARIADFAVPECVRLPHGGRQPDEA